MSDAHFAVLDPVAGISGDMLLGALVSAGAPREWLQDLPRRLGLSEVRVEVESTDRCGIEATKVSVLLPGGVQEQPSAIVEEHHAHEHTHGSSHAAHSISHHPGEHRHIGELIARIERAGLSAWVEERAVRAFKLLGEAEGR
ncbi:MAG TPA: nickel insertion protein, partial [Gemmatimonadales bacterium]|nr:nickel insertion protein [Gemmatimonadales bacterium]